MELYENHVLEIFKKNFNFPIVETPMGTAIKMDPINAFLFANVTGAGYFDNPTFLFSPKGTQKTLREAFHYNLVTGIYNGPSLFYSPSELHKKRPYIFDGPKYIIFKEFKNECQLSEELQDSFDSLISSGKKPTDYIISRIETSKTGNGMEPFLEYLTCEHFKKYGYIVENQVPLAATVGSPDFAGYKICGNNIGFHINELSLIRFTKNIKIAQIAQISSVIVGEAKTSTTIMEKQLKKYLDTQLFEKGFEIHPSKLNPSISGFGLINISPDYTIQCKDPVVSYTFTNNDNSLPAQYISWINQYLKFFLMANFTQTEFCNIIQRYSGKPKYCAEDILTTIKRMSLNEIISEIQEVI